MPKWGWWLAGLLLFLLWNFDSIGDYWFQGWWQTVRYRPLGDWHARDVIPFVAAYLAIKQMAATIDALPKLEQQEQAQNES